MPLSLFNNYGVNFQSNRQSSNSLAFGKFNKQKTVQIASNDFTQITGVFIIGSFNDDEN